MKVLVMTRHAIANYGSLLQAIATQKIIESLNCECEIVDFIRKDEYMTNSILTIGRTKPKWNRKPLIFAAYCAMRFPENIMANTKFGKMRQKYLKMTKRYYSAQELKENKPFADVYMTGSDQVWGPVLCGDYEWAYYLDFCNESDKKIAFASSFGKMNVSQDIKKQMKEYLSKYSSIAVRENSAVEFIQSIGIDAKQVLDPTLLLTAEDWSQYISSEKKKGEYVLVYQIHNNPKLSKYAVEFAKRAGLPLIRVSPMFHQIKRGGRLVCLPDVGEFLSYIKNAKYLVTDSFHGTAFAINFNTPFIEVLPDTGTGSRNQSILKLTGLESRIVTDLNDFHLINEKADFTKANSIIEAERKKSINILKNIIFEK